MDDDKDNKIFKDQQPKDIINDLKENYISIDEDKDGKNPI